MKRSPAKRNPIARAVRKIRPQVIPNKKRYNRKRDKRSEK